MIKGKSIPFRHGLLLILAAYVSPASAAPLTVSGPLDGAPYAFLDESGRAAGLEIDLLKAAARHANLDLEFVARDWSAKEEGDVLMARPVVGTKGDVRFTRSIGTRHQAVFVSKDSPIRGLEDLRNGKRVAVVHGANTEEYLTKSGIGVLVPCHNARAALKSVKNGIADAAVVDRYAGVAASKEVKGLGMTGKQFFGREYAFAAVDEGILSSLEKGLRVVERTGQAGMLTAKWLDPLSSKKGNFKVVAAYIQWVILPLILLFGAAIAQAMGFRKKFTRRIVRLERELAQKRTELEELKDETSRQRYVMNQLSTVTLVDQLMDVSGSKDQK